MASSNRMLSCFSAKRPCFMKVIHDSNIQQGELDLSKKFVNRCGISLNSSVVLYVPTGDGWPMKLMRQGSDVWLHNGWRAFTEFYSLEFGSSVLLEYDGDNEFIVFIFDKTATEIQYPYRIDMPQCKQECESSDDDCVEIPYPYVKTGSSTSVQHSKEHTTDRGFGEKSSSSSSSAEKKRSRHRFLKKPNSSKHQESKTSKAFLRAMAYESKYPRFEIRITTTNVKGYRAKLPLDFVYEYLNDKQTDTTVTLKASSGKKSVVTYFFSSPNGRDTAAFYKGWKRFSQANSLKAGDVCVFELLNKAAFKMKVSIFRERGNI